MKTNLHGGMSDPLPHSIRKIYGLNFKVVLKCRDDYADNVVGVTNVRS